MIGHQIPQPGGDVAHTGGAAQLIPNDRGLGEPRRAADEHRLNAATTVIRTRLPDWLGPGLSGYRRADGQPHRTRDPHEYTDLLCRIHPVGSPERCRRRPARSAARTGIRHLILMVEGCGHEDRTLDNIHRLGAADVNGAQAESG
jgi:hypothetical protein